MAKSILQTLGTITSLVLAFISIKVAQYNHIEGISSSEDLTEFTLTISTVVVMILTGFSYYNSRLDHGGFTYFLYACLGVVHFILAPIAVVIAGMKIDFGEYWWVVLIGIVILLIWGNGYKDVRN